MEQIVAKIAHKKVEQVRKAVLFEKNGKLEKFKTGKYW